MCLIHRKLTLIAPTHPDSGRGFPSANVILVAALTSFFACAPAAVAQGTQVSSVASSQAPEQCNYATDQDPRPAVPNASAEAASAANTYAPPDGSATNGLRLPELKPELKSDSASAVQQNVECKPEDGKSVPSEAPKTATPAAVPAPTQPTPLVAYSNGMLTITAHDARFGDVLDAIKARAGVVVQYPAGLANDRVFDDIGPAPMREVLMAFLEGSRFNYVMQGSSSNSQIVSKLILTPRTGGPATAANQPAPSVQQPDAYGAVPMDYTQREQDEPQVQPVPAAHVNPLPASVG
ncbi:MAG TPA: hypothetical protein VN223_09520, partial [Candidatus Elarobacter sp.]|nr:hypothetical protein [Candidatus Elarobacter sp.]